MSVIRFDRDDLTLFSEASHDRSRLHMSDEYARRTSYGEAIVFGILGAFASLGSLRDRPGQELAKVSLTYRSALYMDVDYQITVNERSPARASVTLADQSGATMMSSDFRFRDASSPAGTGEVAGMAPVLEQAEWDREGLQPGVEVSGRYAPEPASLRQIMARWHLLEKGATAPQVAMLLWSSFLTGMHLPGLRGTSAQLMLAFRPDGPPPRIPFDYRTRVVGFDDRFRLLHSASELSGDDGVIADAEVWSLLREDGPPASEG